MRARELLLPTLVLCRAVTGEGLSSGWTPLRNVVITGATHGNEYNGLWCLKRWRAAGKEPWLAYPSLNVSTVVANPKAYRENVRYIDEDLNRQFKAADLNAPNAWGADGGGTDVEAYERNRARALAAELGPKVAGTDPAADFVIDLHTTTSNMHITIIVDKWCTPALEAAAYAVRRLNAEKRASPRDAEPHVARILVMDVPSRLASPFVCSVGRNGLQIEVGPTPQGVIRQDVIDSLDRATQLILSYLDRRNRAAGAEAEVAADGGAGGGLAEVEAWLYDHEGKIPWPVDSDGRPTAVTASSLQGQDYEPVSAGDKLFQRLDGSHILYEPKAPAERAPEAEGSPLVGGPHDGTRDPIFINEAASYSPKSGLGIGVVRKVALRLDGRILED